MIKFNKLLTCKIISLIVAVLFVFNSSVYGIDLPRNTYLKLRVPVGETDTYKRLTEAIKTWEEQEKVIDPNLDAAHKDNRAKLLHKTEKGTKVIEEAHNFLEANGFSKNEIVLFTSLQERAIIEVPGWDKGGLWLVTPNKDETLPYEHASDRGGMHIVAYPDADLARSYVHGMAAYVGLSHDQAEALENAFIAWRNEKKPIPEELKEKFRERIKGRNEDPLLLTHLSEREKEETYQRDYARFLFSHRSDPQDTYRRLLRQVLREGEAVYKQFLIDNNVPEAGDMARSFAEDALASIIRRETESNFKIPYLPEDFPTLLQLMDNIADKLSSEQEIFLNKYIRQIVGALLFLEIPAYLRKQWSQNAEAGQKFPLLLGDGDTTIVGAMSQSDLQREYEELNRELLRLGEERTQAAETYKDQPLKQRIELGKIEKQLEAIRARMREIDDQLRPLKGGMHDSAKRFKALQRFLKIYNIDMGAWIDEQASKMLEQDRASITDALTKIGLGDSQIKSLLSIIILCEIPGNIRLEGKGRFASRIGGLIVRTKGGYRILFPKERLSEDINNKEYLGDLLHEVEELNLIESGMQVDRAHEQAMVVRSKFLNGEPFKFTDAKALFKPQAAKRTRTNL
jgi:hypothetical protein